MSSFPDAGFSRYQYGVTPAGDGFTVLENSPHFAVSRDDLGKTFRVLQRSEKKCRVRLLFSRRAGSLPSPCNAGNKPFLFHGFEHVIEGPVFHAPYRGFDFIDSGYHDDRYFGNGS